MYSYIIFNDVPYCNDKKHAKYKFYDFSNTIKSNDVNENGKFGIRVVEEEKQVLSSWFDLSKKTLKKLSNGSKNIDLGLGPQESTNDKSCLNYKPKSKVNMPTYHKVHLDYDTKSQKTSRTRVGKKVSRKVILSDHLNETIKPSISKRPKRVLEKYLRPLISSA